MTELLLMCSAQSGAVLPMIGPKLVGNAAKAINVDPETINMTGVMTIDEKHGKDSIRIYSESASMDAVVAFGKTCSALYMSDMPMFTIQPCIIEGQLFPVNVLRLPSLLSAWWHEPENVEEAISRIASVIGMPRPFRFHGATLAWGSHRWN